MTTPSASVEGRWSRCKRSVSSYWLAFWYADHRRQEHYSAKVPGILQQGLPQPIDEEHRLLLMDFLDLCKEGRDPFEEMLRCSQGDASSANWSQIGESARQGIRDFDPHTETFLVHCVKKPKFFWGVLLSELNAVLGDKQSLSEKILIARKAVRAIHHMYWYPFQYIFNAAFSTFVLYYALRYFAPTIATPWTLGVFYALTLGKYLFWMYYSHHHLFEEAHRTAEENIQIFVRHFCPQHLGDNDLALGLSPDLAVSAT